MMVYPIEPIWLMFWKRWPIEWKVNLQKNGLLGSSLFCINEQILDLVELESTTSSV